eukprot:scaffold43583_cov60-Phaeocystis_antarctica.AAC.1
MRVGRLLRSTEGVGAESHTGSQRWRRVAGSRSREGVEAQRFAQASRLGVGGVVLAGWHASRVRIRHAVRRWRRGRHREGGVAQAAVAQAALEQAAVA